MVDWSKVGTGAGLIGIGLATPIPVIDETIAAIIGIPLILSGLGQEQAAKEVKEKTG